MEYPILRAHELAEKKSGIEKKDIYIALVSILAALENVDKLLVEINHKLNRTSGEHHF